MPLYCWEDKKTGKQVEIMRSFDEYRDLPLREEAKELTDEEFAAAEWTKILGTPNVVKGRGWGGGKGYW